MKNDYRNYLRDELSARQSRNPKYSLRAFARDLGVPVDQLSSIFHRRYGLSRERAAAMAERLGLGLEETTLFCNLVEAEHGRSEKKRQSAKAALTVAGDKPRDANLSLDAFKVVADWYHFAILELAEIDGGRLVAIDIARRLGITKAEAKAAVARLLRLEMLVERQGFLAATTQESYAPPGIVDRSKRRFLSQLGAKGVEAIEAQPPEEREYSSDMLSIAEEDLPAIREEVRNFRRALVKIALKPGKKSKVYCVNVQCFKVGE